MYPFVPGHEIIGQVRSVGAAVSASRSATRSASAAGLVPELRVVRGGPRALLRERLVGTYNGVEDAPGTLGGYSSAIVVDQDFVLRIAPDEHLAAVAPLLCAGITTYSPLGTGARARQESRRGRARRPRPHGDQARPAMGAEVTLFTTSPGKADDASASVPTSVVVSSDAEQMGRTRQLRPDHRHRGGLARPRPLLAALLRDGTMVLVGVPPSTASSPGVFKPDARAAPSPAPSSAASPRPRRCSTSAPSTTCSDIEMIRWSRSTTPTSACSYDVKYRFVIDMASMPAAVAP